MSATAFETELLGLINKHSMESGSDTPDFILARFLRNALFNFNDIVTQREIWYGRTAPMIVNRIPIPKHWVHHVPARPGATDYLALVATLEEELRVVKIDRQRYKDTLEALENTETDSWTLKQIHRALHPRPAVKGALKFKRRGKR